MHVSCHHLANIDQTDSKKKKKASEPPSAAASPSPPVNPLEENARETFHTGRPLEDNPDLQQCKHCKKSVLKTAAKEHIAACLRLKKEKAQRKKEAREARERAKEAAREEEARKAEGDDKDDDSDDDKKGGKKANGDEKGKKRKADGTLEGPKAKKKKDDGKAKAPKTKGPVDVERQCGVILPNGQPCARSLTCKSHSMGAKRAVPGRSLPYDMLLAAYQKKNQAKQQSKSLISPRSVTVTILIVILQRLHWMPRHPSKTPRKKTTAPLIRMKKQQPLCPHFQIGGPSPWCPNQSSNPSADNTT